MRRIRTMPLLLSLMFCAAVAAQDGTGTDGRSGGKVFHKRHGAKGHGRFSCLKCHTPHSPKGKKLWAMPVKKKTRHGTALVGEEPLCYSCHNTPDKGANFFEPGKSHPINVVPPAGMEIPAVLGTTYVPGIGRVITCLSCHDPHLKTPYMLKVPLKDGRLCKSCHKDK